MKTQMNRKQAKIFQRVKQRNLGQIVSKNISKRKKSKFVVELKESGKKVHFGNPNYEDYLRHKDEER